MDMCEATARVIYRELVLKDCYLFQQWGCDSLDYIIDIGANLGVFVAYARMRHPNAYVVAYEPCKEAFEYMCKVCGYMKRVRFNNVALGDGSKLAFCDTGWLGCNQCFKPGERDIQSPYEVSSVTLSGIFDYYKIPLTSNYFIKIDCEGGERFLLTDSKCVEIVRHASGFALEVHFPPIGGGRPSSVERFNGLPEWKEYNSWIRGNFSQTHAITYHRSRKHLGVGVYVLKKR